jgi:hypothetical protein
MLYRVPLWRTYDANDGANGGAGGEGAAGAPAVAPPTPEGSAPPPSAPQLDPQAYQALLVQNARLQAQVAYPQADVALIGTLTDPAAIDAVARRTHELALAAQPPGGGQPAGVPVPSANAATAAEGEEQRRIRELQYKVRQRMRPGARGGRTVLEPYEAEEARDLFYKMTWNGHMEHRRTGRGNVSEPPRGAPAVAQPPTLPAPGRSF